MILKESVLLILECLGDVMFLCLFGVIIIGINEFILLLIDYLDFKVFFC